MNFKICTYNIDGLPEELDLRELPWLLKPLSWIYKWIKGTTKIKINDNLGRQDKTFEIGEYIGSNDFDLCGLQEDLNYHEVLKNGLPDSYKTASYFGGIDFKNLRWFPYPRFKCDGISLVFKDSRIKIVEEKRVKWKKSSGYFKGANDKLMEKGFKFYSLILDSQVFLDLYIVHLDADFYDPLECPDVEKDIEARGSQLSQLVDEIEKRNSGNPIIVIGDFNSSPFYSWDNKNIEEYFLEPLRRIPGTYVGEIIGEERGVNRIFFMNYLESFNQVKPKKCYYENTGLSDHKPFIAEIEI